MELDPDAVAGSERRIELSQKFSQRFNIGFFLTRHRFKEKISHYKTSSYLSDKHLLLDTRSIKSVQTGLL